VYRVGLFPQLPRASPIGAVRVGGIDLNQPRMHAWLRQAHTVVGGEHRYRAAYSSDGRHWTWGGVWTFGAGTAPRIGLISHGGDSPQATAAFDYFRVYR
jgi:arabinan endo-1,5-alpha-L-arabinosidase